MAVANHAKDMLDPLAAVVCGCGDCRALMMEELAAFQTQRNTKCLHWYVGRAMVASAMVRLMCVMEPDNTIAERAERLNDLLTADPALTFLIEQMAAILEAPEVPN
jgi:Tat protein secretion system quality control protein TatD with DNase activity